MKKVIMPLVIALVAFGASAAASWYLQQKRNSELAAQSQSADEASESDDENATLKDDDEKPAPINAQKRVVENADSSHRLGLQHESRASDHPAFATEVEESVHIASSLRERMSAVRERESQLAQRNAQLELVLKDIRAQRAVIDELRKQVNEEFKAAEEHIATMERQRAEIDAQQQSLQDRVTELDVVERDGTKRLATVYDGMDSDRAAKILEHMVNSGKMDTAVKVLGGMRERQAAKVLGEFEDTSLAAQLSERLKGLKKPPAVPKG
jgi:flagellar motility protein MotE (MotC chaperone)